MEPGELYAAARLCELGAVDARIAAKPLRESAAEIERLRVALLKLDGMIVQWARDEGFPPEDSACLRVVRNALADTR